MLTGLCFVPQAAGAFVLSGPAASSSPRSGRAGRWPPVCPSRCWPWPEAPSRCWPGRCLRCWRRLFVLGDRQSPQPGLVHPGRHPGAGRRPVRGHGQRAADRHQAVRFGARRRDLVRDARRRPRRDHSPNRGGDVRRRWLRARRSARNPRRATRAAAPPSPQPHHLFRHHSGGIPMTTSEAESRAGRPDFSPPRVRTGAWPAQCRPGLSPGDHPEKGENDGTDARAGRGARHRGDGPRDGGQCLARRDPDDRLEPHDGGDPGPGRARR